MNFGAGAHTCLREPCLCTFASIYKYAYAVQVMMVCGKAESQPDRAQVLSAVHHSEASNDTDAYTGTEGWGKMERGVLIREKKGRRGIEEEEKRGC